MLPRRNATAGQSTAATSDEETAAAPEVGLGAGSSAARAAPAKQEAATAAMTTAREILEAMILAARKKNVADAAVSVTTARARAVVEEASVCASEIMPWGLRTERAFL
ncbi:hypothetical protein ZWY2020_010322 [Hordeum vulgare]|nr:hypothetical protein ZWY2020_010322 [Hordeum vulgare]